MMTKITLEDKGQNILWFKVNEDGIVEEAGPFQNEIWKDAYIPFRKISVGQLPPISFYPYIIFNFLQYRVISIEPSHETETSVQPQRGA